jgi:hypothetical protein
MITDGYVREITTLGPAPLQIARRLLRVEKQPRITEALLSESG